MTNTTNDLQQESTAERERRTAASPLDYDDPLVQAARAAERDAYHHYGLDFTEHFIEIPALDSRVRVVEVGDGPPVVLIQGGEGKGLMWLPLLPELHGYTLYVVDRPGSGLSDEIEYRSMPLRRIATSSTVGVFDHFDLDTAPVVGNSMGGLWTLRFALEHGERASKIALLGCPAVYPGTSAPFPMRLGSIPLLSGIIAEKVMQPDTVEDVRETWEFLGHPSETIQRLPDEFAEAWYRMDNMPHYKRTWAGILQSVLRLRGADPEAAFTPDDLRNVSPPVALIWGSEDPFGSVEQGRSGAEYFPDAAFHEVGTGHLPWLDEPERCGELLRDFLG
jgi:pimeloyl-ACP methyl ester carboxylesterase